MGNIALTLFQGRSGDRNGFGLSGACSLANALSDRINLTCASVGEPEEHLNSQWEEELAAARPGLRKLSEHYDCLLKAGSMPVLIMPRCAVGLATLPIVAKYRPDACIVWLDAHADLNTPASSDTGYLGGMVISGAAGLWNSGLGSGLGLQTVILVGLRDLDPSEETLIRAEKISVLPPQADIAAALKNELAGRPAYIHIDCDVLDAGIVSTEFQVPDGLSLADLHGIAEVLAENEVIGLEIAEYQHGWPNEAVAAGLHELIDAIMPVIV